MHVMPKKSTARKAKAAQRSGKKASTAAGEFVGEEIHRQKRGRGAARSRKQAIAIGLSKARKSGVRVKRKSAARKSASRKRTTTTRRSGARRKTAQRRAPSRTRTRRTSARSTSARSTSRAKRRSR
jgi:hypothetical protein